MILLSVRLEEFKCDIVHILFILLHHGRLLYNLQVYI